MATSAAGSQRATLPSSPRWSRTASSTSAPRRVKVVGFFSESEITSSFDEPIQPIGAAVVVQGAPAPVPAWPPRAQRSLPSSRKPVGLLVPPGSAAQSGPPRRSAPETRDSETWSLPRPCPTVQVTASRRCLSSLARRRSLDAVGSVRVKFWCSREEPGHDTSVTRPSRKPRTPFPARPPSGPAGRAPPRLPAMMPSNREAPSERRSLRTSTTNPHDATPGLSSPLGLLRRLALPHTIPARLTPRRGKVTHGDRVQRRVRVSACRSPSRST